MSRTERGVVIRGVRPGPAAVCCAPSRAPSPGAAPVAAVTGRLPGLPQGVAELGHDLGAGILCRPAQPVGSQRDKGILPFFAYSEPSNEA